MNDLTFIDRDMPLLRSDSEDKNEPQQYSSNQNDRVMILDSGAPSSSDSQQKEKDIKTEDECQDSSKMPLFFELASSLNVELVYIILKGV